MSSSEELGKLDELHQRGTVSDGESSCAKARVLGQTGPDRSGPGVYALNHLVRSRSVRAHVNA